MATPNIVPRADSEGGLGTASKYWAAAYIDAVYVGAGKVGRDADNALSFATDDLIKFRVQGATRTQLSSTFFKPQTNDQISLGVAGAAFSDLFLADGAVINFDNGDVTLKHTSNKLILGDSDQFGIGNDADLIMYHDTSDSYITNDTGDLYIQNTRDDKDIIFRSDDGSGGTTAYITIDGSVAKTEFAKHTSHKDNIKAYFGDGLDLEIYHDGSTSAFIHNKIGDLYIKNDEVDHDIYFQCDDGSGGLTNYLTLDGGLGYTTAQKNMRFADSVYIEFGDGGDFQINHSGVSSAINNTTGPLYIKNGADNEDIIFQCDNGAGGQVTYFYLDGSSAAHNGSATTALYTNWPDNSRISLGTSHDLTIHHSGTSSAFANAVGHLEFIQSADDSDIKFYCDDGSGGIAEYLRLDGTNVRTLVKKNLNVEDNVQVQIGNSQDLKLYHNSSHSFIEQQGAGDLYIQSLVDDGDIIFSASTGSASPAEYLRFDGGAGNISVAKTLLCADGKGINIGASNDLQISHNGSDSGVIKNTVGNLTISNEADDGDILFKSDNGAGGTATYFKIDGATSTHDGSAITALYTNWPDNSQITLGSSHDLRIYHDGSNSYISDVGTGSLILQSSDLFLRTNSTENAVVCAANAGVTLYYDNVAKLATTSAGVDVTGGITVTGDSSVFTSANANDPIVEIRNTTNDATAARLRFNKNRGVDGVDEDDIGLIEFASYDDGTPSTQTYANILAEIHESAVGDEAGRITMNVANDGTLRPGLKLEAVKGTAARVNVNIGNGTGSTTTIAGRVQINSNYTANTDANDLQIGSATTGNGGLSIITGNSNTGGIYFADQDNNDAGRIKYIHSSNALLFDTNRTNALTIDSSQNATFSGSVTPALGVTKPIASAAANVAAAVAGSIYTFSDADGAIVTLPDSGGGGLVGQTFEFVCTATATSNSHKVIFSDTTNEKFIGRLTAIDTDTDNTQLVYVPATANKAIVMNGTTTGITGSRFTITNVAADVWMIEGYVHHTGNTANPFANS